jgi:hypothetical protein
MRYKPFKPHAVCRWDFRHECRYNAYCDGPMPVLLEVKPLYCIGRIVWQLDYRVTIRTVGDLEDQIQKIPTFSHGHD